MTHPALDTKPEKYGSPLTTGRKQRTSARWFGRGWAERRRMAPEELRKIRGENSQEWLADKLGVAQPRVSDWESGKRKIPEYIKKLLELLKASGKI
jgi:DNA-binding transcriptional regulator YiaG